MWPHSRSVAIQPPSSRQWPKEHFQPTASFYQFKKKAAHLPPKKSGFFPSLDDGLPHGGGVTTRSEALAQLETVLFVAQEPLNARKLAQLADLEDGTAARTLVHELNRLYDKEHRAFRIIEVGGGFQIRTRPQFAPWLTRLHSATIEVRLSAPAMETLAVVAYRQPVLRATVEAIRGVQCGEMLRQLMERDLVRITGRSLELGRPFLYGTTKRFLQVFGLGNIDDLPHREWFESEPAEIESQEPDEENDIEEDVEQDLPEPESSEPVTE